MRKYDKCPKCGNRKRDVSKTCIDCYRKIPKTGIFNHNYRHGHASHDNPSPTYISWIAMISRCRDKNNKHFHDYGGRGITVCKKWKSFQGFLEDMGSRPKNKTIDRINNDGNYKKANCKWSTWSEQAYNRREKSY